MTAIDVEREAVIFGETAEYGFVLLALDRGLEQQQRQKFVRVGARAVRPTIEPSTEAISFELDEQRFGDDEVLAISTDSWEIAADDLLKGVVVEQISAKDYRQNLDFPELVQPIEV